MNPKLRRICWMLVVASLALSGLSACSYSSLFGAGAGLGFAGFVTALLLLVGTTQTGCSTHACLSIEACLSPPLADAGPNSDAHVGPCLSPPYPSDANVGPCLDVQPPDAQIGPCLSPPAPDAGVGVCLSVDADLGPCLSPPQDPPDADLGPCLSPPADPPDATADSRVPTKPADSALASADRQQVLERLQDRLPDDVKDRLGLKKV
ncbi:MAG TPA: hypothetical protein VGK67_02700 [Myxococcales bacterium]|jgi:hypothetical protein